MENSNQMPQKTNKKFPKWAWWVIGIVGAVVLIGIGWWVASAKYKAENQKLKDQLSTTSSTTSSSTTTTSTSDPYAGWKTYTNDEFGFSFKYPPEWSISHNAENYNDARKYLIELSKGNDKYLIEVINAGDMTLTQFIDEWYGGLENGPTYVTETKINGAPAAKFFMQKSYASDTKFAGSGYISFIKDGNSIDISTGGAVSKDGQSLEEFANSLKNDSILNSIASSLKFSK